jgi:hypothetical protein
MLIVSFKVGAFRMSKQKYPRQSSICAYTVRRVTNTIQYLACNINGINFCQLARFLTLRISHTSGRTCLLLLSFFSASPAPVP